MEEYANSTIFLKKIETAEKAVTIAIALNKNDFSIFSILEKEYRPRRDLVKPFEEHIPFSQFDRKIMMHEGQYFISIDNPWIFFIYSGLESLLHKSRRSDDDIEKKIYYERNYRVCPKEKKACILEQIEKLKNKEK